MPSQITFQDFVVSCASMALGEEKEYVLDREAEVKLDFGALGELRESLNRSRNDGGQFRFYREKAKVKACCSLTASAH
jgi:uncharacterized protein YfiM (DUF2279 family)